MSDDAVLNEAELQAEFGRLSGAKGDRLSEVMTGDAHPQDDHDQPEPTGPQDAAPDGAPAASAADANAQPAKTAAAPAAAETDIWANAPAELRDAHQRALAQADQRYRSDIGRQAAYQRKIQLQEEELKKLRAGQSAPAAATDPSQPQPQDGKQPAQPAPAAKTSLRDDPKIKRALEEYPDVVEPLLSVNETLAARLDDIARDVSLSNEERQEQTIAAQEAALDAAHSDWRAACSSKDFADWLNTQPASIKAIAERNGENIVDAEEAIAMVSSFKAHWLMTHPQPQPEPQPQAQPGQDGQRSSQPTNLQARRDAQLRAANAGRTSNGPAAVPDGPSNDAGAEAIFNHFAAKKAGNRR